VIKEKKLIEVLLEIMRVQEAKLYLCGGKIGLKLQVKKKALAHARMTVNGLTLAV